jgi:hypothetical protein
MHLQTNQPAPEKIICHLHQLLADNLNYVADFWYISPAESNSDCLSETGFSGALPLQGSKQDDDAFSTVGFKNINCFPLFLCRLPDGIENVCLISICTRPIHGYWSWIAQETLICIWTKRFASEIFNMIVENFGCKMLIHKHIMASHNF